MTAIAASLPHSAASDRWKAHLMALGICWAALLLLFGRDAADMAETWWVSSTFNHCLLIVPIIAWLVWQHRPALAEIAPSAWAPGLFLAGMGAFAWLLGEAASVALARQLGLVLMGQAAVLACLGRDVGRLLAFPIFYAIFLVPFGEELVPALQTLTAGLVTFMLDLSRVPAHLEGIFITTASGYFEVAEACAGAKFLIAMVALGALVAHLCFRSWKRRIVFLAASILVPIIANAIRAWGTIMVADQAGIAFAASFDHVVYGGVFFAIVIGLMLLVARPFFDRPAHDVTPAAPAYTARNSSPWKAAAGFLGIVCTPPLWSAALATTATPIAPSYDLPDIAGWQKVGTPSGWRPHFAGADRLTIARYRDSRGHVVDLAIAVYARQDEDREVVGFGQGAASPENDWVWMRDMPAPPGGRAERITSRGLVRDAVTFYRVGEVVTGSEIEVKIETMKARLLGGPQRAVAVIVSAPLAPEGSGQESIRQFLADLGPVDRLADQAAGTD